VTVARLGTTPSETVKSPRAPRNRDRSEQGASLIIALIFIVVIAVIVGAISSMAINDLGNTTHFNAATATDNAASNVANLAIQSVRYVPQATNNVAGPCWGTGTSQQTFVNDDNATVDIWCTTAPHDGSSQTRVVTMWAGTPANCSTAASCKANPLLTVVEAYDDYTASGTDTCPTNPSNETCGLGATTLVWTWGSLSQAVGGLILNTIVVTSTPQSPVANGPTYTPTASTTSGDPVTITTPTVSPACSVSNGVVSFLAGGTCTLNFNDPGNFNYAPAGQVNQQFSVGP
jgi:Tfp pilus assembly protein PilV